MFLLWLALSLLYYLLTSMLLLFGYIVGWDNTPGHPWIGGAMLLAGGTTFVFGPRLVRKLTGRNVPSPPPGA
jgi:hypothetical protein